MSATWSGTPTIENVRAAVTAIEVARQSEDLARAAWRSAQRDSEAAHHELYHAVVKASAFGVSDEEIAAAVGRSIAWVLSTRTSFPLCHPLLGCRRAPMPAASLPVEAER